MYGDIYIISHISVVNDSIQTKNYTFITSHIKKLFTEFQPKRSNIRAVWINYLILFILYLFCVIIHSFIYSLPVLVAKPHWFENGYNYIGWLARIKHGKPCTKCSKKHLENGCTVDRFHVNTSKPLFPLVGKVQLHVFLMFDFVFSANSQHHQFQIYAGSMRSSLK